MIHNVQIYNICIARSYDVPQDAVLMVQSQYHGQCPRRPHLLPLTIMCLTKLFKITK